MSVSVRSHLVAGVAALAVSATVLSPVGVSLPGPETPAIAHRVDLAASVKPLVMEPMSPETIATARAVIERIDPEAQLPLQTAAIVAPTPQNGLSSAIISGYQFIQYWVDYGVQLADYVLGFIPYGYLIGDQVSIVYFNLVRPISDSVVYGLVVPVVNDPLNIWSYVNGAVIVGQTTINALINTGIAEFNYFFGWLIPPLPPLPLAATETTALKTEALTLKTAEVTEEPADEPATETADRRARRECHRCRRGHRGRAGSGRGPEGRGDRGGRRTGRRGTGSRDDDARVDHDVGGRRRGSG